jgi:hypothetical protein
MTLANSVDPDRLAHPCCLIRICTGCFRFIRSDQDVTSADLDQTARMCWLIWIYAGRTWVKTRIYGVKRLTVWKGSKLFPRGVKNASLTEQKPCRPLSDCANA